MNTYNLLLFVLGLSFISRSDCQQQPPNIIVLMADDVGHDDVGFHGSTQVLTPNIDALAADGVILNSYYTSPICTPSRSAFLSGVHPINSGEQHYVILNGEPRGFSLDFKLLPQYLKESQYSTHLVGKWHLGFYLQMYTPLYRGFDSFYGFYGPKIDYFSLQGEQNGKLGLDFRDNMFLLKDNSSKKFVTHRLTDRALDIIQNHDNSHPLYLHLAYPNTHCGNSYAPLQAPQDIIDMFRYIKSTRRRTYAANLFTMDQSIGSIVSKLEEKGFLRNSIIVFVSDNGAGDRGIYPNGGSNWPLRGVKATLWEGGIRVPAFIWSPLLNRSSYVFKGLMHVTDWLPTLLEAAVGEDQGQGDFGYGLSLWKSLSNDWPSPRYEMLHNIDPKDNTSAIRLNHLKLIQGFVHPHVSGWLGSRPESESGAGLIDRDESPVSRALFKLDRHPKYSIFKETIVNCSKRGNNASSLCHSNVSPCLFNITEDPCEFNNIAESNPSTVSHMLAIINTYNFTAVKPRNKPIDPNSDPDKHGFAWVSWEDVEGRRSGAPSPANTTIALLLLFQLMPLFFITIF